MYYVTGQTFQNVYQCIHYLCNYLQKMSSMDQTFPENVSIPQCQYQHFKHTPCIGHKTATLLDSAGSGAMTTQPVNSQPYAYSNQVHKIVIKPFLSTAICTSLPH